MAQNSVFVAPSVHQGLGQDRQSVKGSVFVDSAGKAQHILSPPARIESNWTERVAKDVSEQDSLRRAFYQVHQRTTAGCGVDDFNVIKGLVWPRGREGGKHRR